MNTRKRLQSLRRKASPVAVATPVAAAMLDRPVCMIDGGQMCEHALVDRDLNRLLFDYERTVRSRFTRIVDVLKRISAHQHDENFIGRAQQLAREQLGFDLPTQVLEDAWVCGLDLSALHSRCIFSALKLSVDNAQTEQVGWRQRLPLDENFLRSCGYHTVDISPCSDGRLQGVGAYVLRFCLGQMCG